MARKPTRRRRPRPTLFQRLRADFLTGLVVVLPLFVTGYLLWFTIGFVDARVIPLIPRAYNPEDIFGRNIFGLGVIVFLGFTTLVGALAKGYIGRNILRAAESVVERTPIVNTIYNGLKQIAETLFNQSGQSFQGACLVEFPRRGLYAVAFISTDTRGEIPRRLGEPDLVSIFLPTSPNPTSGFLLFVPRRDIRPLEMSLEEAAKLVISAGLVAPPDRSAAAPPAAAQSAPAPGPTPSQPAGARAAPGQNAPPDAPRPGTRAG